MDVISIDGIKGIGKTTQINLLSKFFKNEENEVIKLTFESNLQSALECLQKIDPILVEKPKTKIIIDGSIARMMVIELLQGVSSIEVSQKYMKIINEYEKLTHKYKMINLLLITDDVEMCRDRLIRQSKILKTEFQDIDLSKEEDIVMAMRIFDSNVISKQIQFKTIYISKEDSMLDVHENIKELI